MCIIFKCCSRRRWPSDLIAEVLAFVPVLLIARMSPVMPAEVERLIRRYERAVGVCWRIFLELEDNRADAIRYAAGPREEGDWPVHFSVARSIMTWDRVTHPPNRHLCSGCLRSGAGDFIHFPGCLHAIHRGCMDRQSALLIANGLGGGEGGGNPSNNNSNCPFLHEGLSLGGVGLINGQYIADVHEWFWIRMSPLAAYFE